MLSPEVQAEILTRHFSEKKSARAIALEFGVSRKAVRRLIKRRTIAAERALTKRRSILDPFAAEVERMLARDPGCTGTAIMNRLRELGFAGGITVLRDWLREKRRSLRRPREAFLRLEFAPGECAQVDWGEFGPVFGDGVKIHCFAIVLCHSRLLHIEFTRSEKFEDFVRCHETAFRFFGGAPRECWYDNLGSAVTERIGSLIKFNARFLAYMGHQSVRPHACNVARGNEKGRVEDLIKYVRMNFWPGRAFKDMADLNAQALAWRDGVANQREHRSTRKVPRLLFEAEEKGALLGLNPHPYDSDEIFSRVVPKDFHVLYETNRYSVPWTLCGITVTVRSDAESVRVYYDQQFVTRHSRSYLKNRVFTNEAHKKGLLARKPGAEREAWQVCAVKSIGPRLAEYVDFLKSGERSLRSELAKILALSTVYGDGAVNEAAGDLLARGIVGVAAMEATLRACHHPAAGGLAPEPLKFTNDKLNRVVPAADLRRYDALLFEADKAPSAPEEALDEKGTDAIGGEPGEDPVL